MKRMHKKSSMSDGTGGAMGKRTGRPKPMAMTQNSTGKAVNYSKHKRMK